MLSHDIENLARALEQFSPAHTSEADEAHEVFVRMLCANLRSLADQVHSLESVPLESAPLGSACPIDAAGAASGGACICAA